MIRIVPIILSAIALIVGGSALLSLQPIQHPTNAYLQKEIDAIISIDEKQNASISAIIDTERKTTDTITSLTESVASLSSAQMSIGAVTTAKTPAEGSVGCPDYAYELSTGVCISKAPAGIGGLVLAPGATVWSGGGTE